MIPETNLRGFLKRKRGLDDGVSGFRRERTRNAKLSAAERMQTGWDLRLTRGGAGPDDILDFRVSFPGAAEGAE